MQPAALLEELASQLMFNGHTIDVFTNGSLKPFPEWFKATQVSVILDWKLAGSGEADTGVDIRIGNLKTLSGKDMVKFVVTNMADFEEARTIWDALHYLNYSVKFSAGVAWGKMRERDLLNHILIRELPWQLNVQVHKYVFSPDERQI